MKYLPVDYTPSFSDGILLWLVIVAVAMAVSIIIAGIRESIKTRSLKPVVGTSIVAAIGLVVIWAFILVIPTRPDSFAAVIARLKQAPEIQKTIENTYGLKPTVSEVRSLGYPTVKPTKDFEVFGSFKDRKQVEGTQFEQRTIYLVWADGKFGLSQSSDGESFTPLKTQG